jgi:hypothetical protein
MPYAFPTGVKSLLNDTFKHLGVPGVYHNSVGDHPVHVLVKELERWAEVGRGAFLNARITFEVHIDDIPLIKVGDTFTIGDRDYKVHQEPLRDPTGTIWTVEGGAI